MGRKQSSKSMYLSAVASAMRRSLAVTAYLKSVFYHRKPPRSECDELTLGPVHKLAWAEPVTCYAELAIF